jgi:hypothetical protein
LGEEIDPRTVVTDCLLIMNDGELERHDLFAARTYVSILFPRANDSPFVGDLSMLVHYCDERLKSLQLVSHAAPH